MNKYIKRILTRFFILASFFTLWHPPSLYAQDQEKQQETFPSGNFRELKEDSVRTVTDIIDPLSIKLDDGRIIQLAGLDYPDLDYHAPGKLAQTAKKILEDFLLKQKVTVYTTKKPDEGRTNRMGHSIAHLTRKDNDIWVQGLILKLGLARVRTEKTNTEMVHQMYDIEKAARDEKIGLWDDEKFKILTPEEAKLKSDGYAIIEGQIYKVAMKKNKMYLNFGQNWRSDFTVAIDSKNRKDFQKDGINPLDWNGKKIRVRGWMTYYNGPYMEIDHPERIEILSTPGTPPETGDAKDAPQKNDEKTNPSDMMNNTDQSSALPVLNK